MSAFPHREPAGLADLDHLLTWRESSTSGVAIAAALEAARLHSHGVLKILRSAEQVLLTGAGSSYYIAQAVAAVAREATRRPYIAAPLSDVILRPSAVLAAGDPMRQPVIVISRSGSTSEALMVAEQMGAAGHPTIAVTCRGRSPLAKATGTALVSSQGDEEAIVMTRSFASMLAMLLRIIADLGARLEPIAAQGSLASDLDRMPDLWAEATAAATTGRRLGATSWDRVVILGGGPALGIAAEWGLKLTETSQIAANVYEPLEFRHGPISLCDPGTLVVGLLGGSAAREEARVIAEAAGLGARTWVLGRESGDPADLSDEVSLIGGDLHPSARLPLLLHPGHALALSLALARGRNPDVPRHLSQVVRFDPA